MAIIAGPHSQAKSQVNAVDQVFGTYRLRMLDLATRLRVTPGGLTRIIDRLVDRGWIQRDRPTDNRREVYATLTSAGAAAHRTARVVYSRVIQETFARHLDQQDLMTLGSIAHKLLDRLRSQQLC